MNVLDGKHAHAGSHASTNVESDAVDPVCEMRVSLESPHRATHDGHEYRFCSAGCRAKFVNDPARFLTKASSSPLAEPAPPGTQYTCPMHPEIVRDAPGHCPICGMALEPMMPSLDDDENPGARRFSTTILVDLAAVAR